MANPNVGSFVSTTNVWDVSEIYSTDVTSPEFKELLVRLYQNLNKMSLSLNTRDAGFYPREEFVCGQVYFPNPANTSATSSAPVLRQVFRKVIYFAMHDGSISPTQTIDFGIVYTATLTFTRIYGVINDVINSQARPLPYLANVAANNITLRITKSGGGTAQLLVYTTSAIYTTYTECYAIVEYIKL